MSAIRQQLEPLVDRAALRSLTIKPCPEGWQLANPWRVVCTGTLDNIDAWPTAAEGYK
ncbi:hypothetical protein [Nocardia lasii]|uniref:Uncharacterized protein n=1 Tax=Nocardia lasii TaxID=1616107 RepID=A0ABW1JLE3_9NOCA